MNKLEEAVNLLATKEAIPFKVKVVNTKGEIIHGTIAGRRSEYPKVFTSQGNFEISWELATRAYSGSIIKI